jgi:hypothetical protein
VLGKRSKQSELSPRSAKQLWVEDGEQEPRRDWFKLYNIEYPFTEEEDLEFEER